MHCDFLGTRDKYSFIKALFVSMNDMGVNMYIENTDF